MTREQNTQKNRNTGRDTKRRILNAAATLFGERGYHNCSVDEIVAASTTSKGSFYFHFSSKESLFASLLEHFSERIWEAVEQAVNMERGAANRIAAAVQAVLTVAEADPQLAKLALIQAPALGPEFLQKQLAIKARFSEAIAAYLLELKEEGRLPPGDLHIMATALTGTVYEILLRSVATDWQPKPQEMDDLIRYNLRALGLDYSPGQSRSEEPEGGKYPG